MTTLALLGATLPDQFAAVVQLPAHSAYAVSCPGRYAAAKPLLPNLRMSGRTRLSLVPAPMLAGADHVGAALPQPERHSMYEVCVVLGYTMRGVPPLSITDARTFD